MTIDYEATTAAAMHKLQAVAAAGSSAAIVSFQRMQPSNPPHKNVNSADCSLTADGHFSG